MTNILPNQSDFAQAYNKGQAQLVISRYPMGEYTPLSFALALKEEAYFALFESVETGEKSRYSCMVMDPDTIWRCEDTRAYVNDQLVDEDVFASLQTFIDASRLPIPQDLPSMAFGVYGFMGYGMVGLMERLPDRNDNALSMPDSLFVRPQLVTLFDHDTKEILLITPVFVDENANSDEAYKGACERLESLWNRAIKGGDVVRHDVVTMPDVSSNVTKPEFCEMVDKAKDYIVAGDIFQVVLSQRFSVAFPYDPLALYAVLRDINPSPYAFYVKMGDMVMVGSSPEILVRVDDGRIALRPIAGTRWRGKTEEEDQALEQELLSDQKELAEHLMLLDLGRNDVGRVAKKQSVTVDEQMAVERYSHVMHIVSHVSGALDESLHALDAWIAGFPAGTVSGAPKIRAMEIIDELETIRRDFYAGGVGYFSADGSMDSCITLRTALIKDGMLYVQAGGGIVADSDPEAEYVESCNKARAIIAAVEQVYRLGGGY